MRRERPSSRRAFCHMWAVAVHCMLLLETSCRLLAHMLRGRASAQELRSWVTAAAALPVPPALHCTSGSTYSSRALLLLPPPLMLLRPLKLPLPPVHCHYVRACGLLSPSASPETSRSGPPRVWTPT